jgi:membrane protease YdiL (CAAX protease family)
MSFEDDNPLVPPPQQGSPQHKENAGAAGGAPSSTPIEPPIGGDPISFAAGAPGQARPYQRVLPEDLSISWSWAHFAAFAIFSILSFVAVEIGVTLVYLSSRHTPSEKDFERFVLSRPELAVGSMVVIYGLVLLFLYLSLSVLPGSPFWRTLGWRSIAWRNAGKLSSPWLYFFGGCGLSVLVLIATSMIQPPEDIPMEELFHYKSTAELFMVMAVLIAPLVEETVFRGYLYPLFAKSFGVAVSVVLTGVLFGLLHGAQLGWTLSLVAALTFVGIVFTFVRARTGTVFASFLLHLGYNSVIAVGTIVSLQGFDKLPPPH